MSKILELEDKIEKIKPQIDRIDETVYNLTQKLEKITDLLIDLVEKKNSLTILDFEYVLLKLNIPGIKYHELPMLISRSQLQLKRTGKFPTLQEFHQKVIEIYELTDEDQKIFTPEVTKNVLVKFMNYEEDYLTVCKMILSTK